MGSHVFLVFGREGLHIVEVRYDFQNLILTRGESLVIGGKLVGDTQHKFFDISVGVVAGEREGIRTEAVSYAGTPTFVGEAEHKERVLVRVDGENADEDGGHLEKKSGFKVFLILSFRDEIIIDR